MDARVGLALLLVIFAFDSGFSLATNQAERVADAWGGVMGVFTGFKLAPVYNVENAPVPSRPDRQLRLDEVEQAIIGAGSKLNWKMTREGEGRLTGTLDLRRHTALVNITFDLLQFSVTYRDSTNLRYENGQIHHNYNEWIRNLETEIKRSLSETLDRVSTTAVPAQPINAAAGAGNDDIKARLQRLEELRRDNLITEEEYQRKRAAILQQL